MVKDSKLNMSDSKTKNINHNSRKTSWGINAYFSPHRFPFPFSHSFPLFNQGVIGALTSRDIWERWNQRVSFWAFLSKPKPFISEKRFRPETMTWRNGKMSFVSFDLGFGTLEKGRRIWTARQGKERGRKNRFWSWSSRDEPYFPVAPLGEITKIPRERLCDTARKMGPQDYFQTLQRSMEREWMKRSHVDRDNGCSSGHLCVDPWLNIKCNHSGCKRQGVTDPSKEWS